MKYFVPQTSGERVRSMTWQSRSDLAVTAACALATSLQEVLRTLTHSQLSLRLFEPVVPESDAWSAVLNGARVHAVRGALASAAFVLRESDAAALARLVLGETGCAAAGISRVEGAVLERIFTALTPALGTLCGANLRRDPAPGEFLTYFEMAAGPHIRIGVALSAQQAVPPSRTVSVGDLASIPVELRIELASGVLTASRVLALHPGDIVPMTTRVDEPGVVRLAGAALARGQCGANGARFALVIQE